MTTFTAKIITPGIPKFVSLDIPGLHTGGSFEWPKIPITELSPDQLDQLIDQWGTDLKKAASKRKGLGVHHRGVTV